MLRLAGVAIEADHIAILRAGLDGLGHGGGESTAQQHVVGRVPLQGVGDGLEVGVGIETLEALEVFLDGRMLGVRQRRLEARVLHQLPGLQIDAPGLGEPLLVAILVAQLLEKGALGGHIGSQAQGAVGQRIAGFRVLAMTAPGQFVVGKIAKQPGIVAMVAGGDGNGPFRRHGEARIEGVGHAAPPVEAGPDGGKIATDGQRQGVGHALAVVESRITPVAERVEAPGLQAVQAVVFPALRVVAAVGALEVSAIEVVPAALIERAALVGVGLGTVVTFAEVRGQGLVLLRQRLEHGFAAFYVGLAEAGRYRVDAQGKERVAFRSHQEPAAIALLGTEEATGLEGFAAQPATVGVLRRQLGKPASELLRLFLGALLQVLVALHLARPVATGVLAVGIHQAVVERFLLVFLFSAEAAEQHVLGGIRLVQRQGHGSDLAAIEFAVDQGGRQPALAFAGPGHRRCRAHAVGIGRGGSQGNQQGLGRTCRQRDLGGQELAVGALDGDIQGDGPVLCILDAKAHGLGLGPVPAAALRGKAQARLLGGVEGEPSKDFTTGGGFSGHARQGGVLGDHLHGVQRTHEVEQGLCLGSQGDSRHPEKDGQDEGAIGCRKHRTGVLKRMQCIDRNKFVSRHGCDKTKRTTRAPRGTRKNPGIIADRGRTASRVGHLAHCRSSPRISGNGRGGAQAISRRNGGNASRMARP
ncbi:hypothetical protein D9M71_173950 [compost metagenome]